MAHMGGCQNYGPFLGYLKIRCLIKIGIQKGSIILTTTNLLYPQGSVGIAELLDQSPTSDGAGWG